MVKICIVTPCLNSEALIAQTLRSVYENALLYKDLSIEHVVWDGVSSDSTVSIIKRFISTHELSNLRVSLFSERDSGIYDAVAKGYSKAGNADIYGFLGAGDYLSPDALSIVADVMQSKNVQWVTGLKVSYNEAGHLTSAYQPVPYFSNLIRCGAYGRWLRFITWESTFWDSSLHSKIDLLQLATYKLAGEQYLWKTFSQYAELFSIQAWLGGFRRHQGQSSSNMSGYLLELREIANKPSLLDYLLLVPLRVADFLPEEIKLWLFTKRIFRCDSLSGKYRIIA